MRKDPEAARDDTRSELDHDSGEIRFKASVEATGADITDATVAGLIRVPVAVMNRYLPCLTAVASGAVGPPASPGFDSR